MPVVKHKLRTGLYFFEVPEFHEPLQPEDLDTVLSASRAASPQGRLENASRRARQWAPKPEIATRLAEDVDWIARNLERHAVAASYALSALELRLALLETGRYLEPLLRYVERNETNRRNAKGSRMRKLPRGEALKDEYLALAATGGDRWARSRLAINHDSSAAAVINALEELGLYKRKRRTKKS